MDLPSAPPARSPLRLSESALGWLCVAVLTALALASAMWAVVLLPPVLDPSVLPRLATSFVLAGPGLLFITLYGGRAARSRAGSLIPAFGWLFLVVALATGTPEGDNPYLLASYQGLLLVPVGASAAALGTVRAHRRPWPPEPASNQAFPAYADS